MLILRILKHIYKTIWYEDYLLFNIERLTNITHLSPYNIITYDKRLSNWLELNNYPISLDNDPFMFMIIGYHDPFLEKIKLEHLESFYLEILRLKDNLNND